MKKSKKIILLILAFCMVLVLAACKENKQDDYSSVQSFEYHFYPDEYEEEYNEFEKTYSLEADTDYQFQVDAVCESGTIEITVTYGDMEEKLYIVSSTTPCNETISIPANTSDTVSFVIHIDADTKGEVIGEMLSR